MWKYGRVTAPRDGGHGASLLRQAVTLKQVFVEIDAPIATLRLGASQGRDVLGVEQWKAVAGAMLDLSERDDVRCIAVLGAGGRALPPSVAIEPSDPAPAPPSDVRALSRAMSAALRAIQACPHPTVAIIDGLCAGGRLEIAASCDMRVCGASSLFGGPVDRSVLELPAGEPEPLGQLLGPGAARGLVEEGDLIGAERARSVGLVNRVETDELVTERGYGLVARIAAGAQLVNPWHKQMMLRLMERRPLTDGERAEAHAAFNTQSLRVSGGGSVGGAGEVRGH